MLNPNLLTTMPTPLHAAPAPAPTTASSADGKPGAFGRELQRAEQAAQDEREPDPEPNTNARSKSRPDTAQEPRSDQAAAERQRSERRSASAAERRPAEPADPAKAAKAAKAKDGRAADRAAGREGSTTPETATTATTTTTTNESAPEEAAAGVDPKAAPGNETGPDIASWLAQMAQRLELARERSGAATRGTATGNDPGTDAGAAAEPGLADAALPALGSERLPATATDRAHAVGVRDSAQASPTATAVLTAQSEARAAFGATLGEAVAAAASGNRPDAHRPDAPAAPTTSAAFATSVAAAASAMGSDAPAAPAPAAVAEDTIAPPVGSREFAQALGTRVAVFARGGIEHARLNLHPAELGPITLQLALDGTQLRVDMSAEAAQTRQVLEQSLPGLASALRDAGLTLSGGGVFQQARDGGNGFGQAAQAGRSGTRGADGRDGGTPEPALVTRPVRLDGLVDLYA